MRNKIHSEKCNSEICAFCFECGASLCQNCRWTCYERYCTMTFCYDHQKDKERHKCDHICKRSLKELYSSSRTKRSKKETKKKLQKSVITVNMTFVNDWRFSSLHAEIVKDENLTPEDSEENEWDDHATMEFEVSDTYDAYYIEEDYPPKSHFMKSFKTQESALEYCEEQLPNTWYPYCLVVSKDSVSVYPKER